MLIKLFKFIVQFIVCIVIIGTTIATSAEDTDYMEEMIISAYTGDIEEGREYEYLRNEKIDRLRLEHKIIKLTNYIY